MKNKNNSIKINKWILLLAFFSFVIIIARGIYLSLSSVVDGTNLGEFANLRTTAKDIIPALRGTIYDVKGDVLAKNVSSYTLIAYLDPKRTTNDKYPQHVMDKELTATKLSEILHISKEEILFYLSKEKIYQTEFGKAGKGIGELEKEKIDSLNLPGLDFIEGYKRYYPNGEFLSYMLGYAKENVEGKIVGELGIEQYYNDILTGVDGFVEYQKDRNGYKIPNTKERKVEPTNGQDIYLTIDSNIQMYIEQALKGSRKNYSFDWETLIMMDAKSGKIIGYGSTPSFDPNIRNMTNYLDPNVSFLYEPGSTMKMFTYMAVMENSKYSGSDTFKSGTYVTKDKTVIGDWDRNGWGYITYDQGFAISSNVGVSNLITNNINKMILKEYFLKLGFGTKTGINVPKELTGKLNFKYETEVLNAGFGQGILTTAIQNIKAMTPIANEGMLLEPYMISKIVDPITKKVIFTGKKREIEKVASNETASHIKDLMDNTINGEQPFATGSPHKMEGYNLIGKTATAQIASQNGMGYLNGPSDVLKSIGLIYPKENPEIILYAVVNKPYNGSVLPLSLPVKEIITNSSKYLNIKQTDDNLEEIISYKMPSLINKNKEDAIKILNNKKTNYVIIGDGDKIIKQYPQKTVNYSSKEKVFLLTNKKEVVMPNLWGLSLKEVENILRLCNIKYELKGNGYVISQSIVENTVITNQDKVLVTLESK
ncbi:MAG: penicillin-binding protein [Bacilli bacterium]